MAYGSSRQFNGWNFFICYLVSLGQIAFGYPASIIGVTLAQPSFLIYMKLLDVTKDPPVLTSNSDQIIGAMSGVRHTKTVQSNVVLIVNRSSKPELQSMFSWPVGSRTNMAENGLSTGAEYCLCLVVHSSAELQTLPCSSSVAFLPVVAAGAFLQSVSN
jgi:hypothetical protein